MEIVIDTSVLIAVIANEPTKPALVAATQGANLVAPLSVHWEIGNAFSAMLKRKVITPSQAMQALEIYAAIPIRFADIELADALHLAAELNIYAYDAYLLRCALKYRLPLLSLDTALNRLAQAQGLTLVELPQ